MPEAWPLLLSEREAARFTSFPMSRVRDMVKKGLFPVHRIHDGKKVWHRLEIESYFASVFGLDAGTKLSDQAVRNAADLAHAHRPVIRQSKKSKR